jgi:hypothetical protein
MEARAEEAIRGWAISTVNASSAVLAGVAAFIVEWSHRRYIKYCALWHMSVVPLGFA